MRRRVSVGRVLVYAALVSGSILMSYPMVYALVGSLCDLQGFYAHPIFPLPPKPNLDNYVILFSPRVDLWRWAVNTLVRIGWYTVITAAGSVLAGYVFARLRFPGRNFLFMYLLGSMMLPGIVFQIPTYIMLARWPLAGGNNWLGQGGHGFINEWPALLIPGWVNVVSIFMLRQTYYTIPADFEEAARVDGAGTLRVLWDVYLPMLKPVLTVLVIGQFVGLWNDYQWPLIVSGGNPLIHTMALGVQRTLLLGLALKGLPTTMMVTDYPFAFALAIVSTLPTILLFLRLQSYFVEGVQGFAIKG